MVSIKILSRQRVHDRPDAITVMPSHHFKANCISSDDTCKPKAYKEIVPSQALAWVRIWMECELNPQ